MEKKTQRLTSELSDKMKEHAEYLLDKRGELKDIEETLTQEKDFYNGKLKDLLEKLSVDVIVGPVSQVAYTQRTTKTLSDELLCKNILGLVENYLPAKKFKEIETVLRLNMSALIENSKEEKLSSPYVVFSIKKNGKK